MTLLCLIIACAVLWIVAWWVIASGSRRQSGPALAVIHSDGRSCCGSCGYELAGLPRGATCPECGTTSRTLAPLSHERANRLEPKTIALVLGSAALTSLCAGPILAIETPFTPLGGGPGDRTLLATLLTCLALVASAPWVVFSLVTHAERWAGDRTITAMGIAHALGVLLSGILLVQVLASPNQPALAHSVLVLPCAQSAAGAGCSVLVALARALAQTIRA